MYQTCLIEFGRAMLFKRDGQRRSNFVKNLCYMFMYQNTNLTDQIGNPQMKEDLFKYGLEICQWYERIITTFFLLNLNFRLKNI